MAYDPKGALAKRQAANYSGEEAGAYITGYDVGYYGKPNEPVSLMITQGPLAKAYPNAFGAGYWDGFADNEADEACAIKSAWLMPSLWPYLTCFVVGLIAGWCAHG